MFRSILVPLDGSAFGAHALPVLLSIARKAQSEIHLVHVHVPVIPSPAVDGTPTYYVSQWEMEVRDQEKEYLASLRERLSAETGLAVHTALLDGPVVDSLVAYAAASRVDAVVMATHGRGGASRAWLGSVADGLVRRCTTPVLLVRPLEKESDPPMQELQRILVPLDGSALAEAILAPAVGLARLTGARLTLLRVVSPAAVIARPASPSAARVNEVVVERRRTEAVEYLDRVAGGIREIGVEVEPMTWMHPQPALGILEYAADRDFDVIAMATHGRGGWSRVALGSVSDKVLRGGKTPVLMQRGTTPGRGTRARAATVERLDVVRAETEKLRLAISQPLEAKTKT